MKNFVQPKTVLIAVIFFVSFTAFSQSGISYKVVDTNQTSFFDNNRSISKPAVGSAFYGQDAHFILNSPKYKNNGDGTITDLVTGLVWQKAYQVLTYDEAVAKVSSFKLAGKSDWRLPSIKEAYSLIDFSGKDASSKDMNSVPSGSNAFINTQYFDFEYGSNGTRVIDTQMLSSTIYKGTTIGNMKTVFGVNLADGRIKGYPLTDPRSRSGKKYTVRFVRGNTSYGKNNFKDNGNGTVTDNATGLMWSKSDSQKGMNWQEALQWVQNKNKEKYLGYSDWRLPNAKELHTIVDYTRSPQSSKSAAINSVFTISSIKNEAGKTDYPFFWSSTTHENARGGNSAVYFAFGEASGFWRQPGSSNKQLMDVHGAGAQRSDPKTGNASSYPQGKGPQGDVIRIDNYIRLVRNVN
jgi:hypothetical protein